MREMKVTGFRLGPQRIHKSKTECLPPLIEQAFYVDAATVGAKEEAALLARADVGYEFGCRGLVERAEPAVLVPNIRAEVDASLLRIEVDDRALEEGSRTSGRHEERCVDGPLGSCAPPQCVQPVSRQECSSDFVRKERPPRSSGSTLRIL